MTFNLLNLRLSTKQLEAYSESTARINIFEGSVRAGKSFIALMRWICFCAEGPQGNLIICGRTDKTIKRNIIDPLQDLLGSACKYFSGKGEVKLYGRTMFVVGANDDRAEAKIRGSEFAGALLDEGTLLPESFFKMLLSRLSKEGAQLFCSTNPDSPYHWIKKDFIDRQHELDLKVFKFSIYDNPVLSKKYIEDLSKEYQGLWKRRYINGEWVVADGAVYDFFNEDIHVIEEPNATADYYIVGIDYGTTNPCVFTLIGYNPANYPNMWLEREYYYDSAKELRQKSDYDYALDLIDFIRGFNVKQIYIDPSATSFKQELKRNGVRKVKDAENDVLAGIRFQSQLLTNGTYKICSQCVQSIREYSNYLWDAKASEKGLDRPLKKFDHCFMAGTKISNYSGQIPIEKVRKGDKVLTRNGYRTVLNVFENERDCSEFILYNQTIRCTPDHKFYTVNSGWKEIKKLVKSDILVTNLKGLPWLKPYSSITSYTNVIKTLKTALTEISTKLDMWTTNAALDISTEIFGNSIMEKYPRECIFVTKTEMSTTIALIISSAYQLLKAFPGVIKIFTKLREKLNANFAKKSTQLHCNLETSFVVVHVAISGEKNITLMMRREYVLSVIENLQLIATQKPSTAQFLVEKKHMGKQKVYNLYVEDTHEYFAEDFLVHNSLDSQRYALYTHFFKKDLRSEFTEADADEMERMYRIGI